MNFEKLMKQMKQKAEGELTTIEQNILHTPFTANERIIFNLAFLRCFQWLSNEYAAELQSALDSETPKP